MKAADKSATGPKRLVGGVLMRGGQVLLGKRSPGRSYADTWDVVGGHCEEGESDEAALLRELHEELGIEAVQYRSLGVYDEPEDRPLVRLHLFVVRGWRGRPTNASAEHTVVAWHDPKHLEGLTLASPRYREILGALVAPERAEHEALASELDRDPSRAEAVLVELSGGQPTASWDYPLVERLMRQLEAIAEAHGGLALRLMAALYEPASQLYAHDVCDAIDLWFQELALTELAPYLAKRLER